MKRKIPRLLVALVMLFGILFGLNVVLAVTGLDNARSKLSGVTQGTGLSGELSVPAGAVIKGVLALVGTIFFGLTIYAGVLWMTAGGEEEKVTRAKDIIRRSIVGLAIIMGAYAITTFVVNRLGVGNTVASSAVEVGGDN